MIRLAEILTPAAPTFRTQDAVYPEIRAACAQHPDLAELVALGTSEEGRPVFGVVLGHGPRTVSLVAGAHADEPVGPETLRSFILEGLRQRDEMAACFAAYRFVVVPHINPDGEARNRRWVAAWPSLADYLRHAVRELPGRDLEFGFPDLRVENRHVARLLRDHAPLDLHMSLHGMGFSEGAMLLIERHWSFRTDALMDGFAAAARQAGLGLHDHNRRGEKGFFYLGPGFNTTPEGEAMRTFFRAAGDEAMAARFRDSSMEFARSLGGDPLCLVTELPLFVVQATTEEPGRPAAYLALRERLPELKLHLQHGRSVEDDVAPFGLRPLDLRTAIGLQLTSLALGLAAIAG
jgi:hypothetical protein